MSSKIQMENLLFSAMTKDGVRMMTDSTETKKETVTTAKEITRQETGNGTVIAIPTEASASETELGNLGITIMTEIGKIEETEIDMRKKRTAETETKALTDTETRDEIHDIAQDTSTNVQVLKETRLRESHTQKITTKSKRLKSKTSLILQFQRNESNHHLWECSFVFCTFQS
jgi:cyanophycinase-like exopeptidase